MTFDDIRKIGGTMRHAGLASMTPQSMPSFQPNELSVSQAFAIAVKSSEDARGDLTVMHHSLALMAARSIDFRPSQIMVSRSNANVLRGMHAQARAPQAKLVTCVSGRVLDVIYDCRPGSPTFGKFDLILLESPEHVVYVPSGCLHGYYAFEDSIVIYATDRLYDPASDGGVHWQALGIPWPCDVPIVSEKDCRLGTLEQWRERCKNFCTQG